MTTIKAQSKRLYFLDNLKVFLTILVIVHHVGQAYGPTGGFWQYKSSMHENIPWLGSFFGINAAFFMGLFFMISGYFLPSSYDRKDNADFLKDKLMRFGIPLLFAFFIISPLEMYFYYINYSGNSSLNFIQYFQSIYLGIGNKPTWFKESIGWPEMNFGHLWFVEHLLVYFTIYFIIRKLCFRDGFKVDNKNFKFLSIVIIGALISLLSSIVRIWYPIDKWIAILGFIQSEVAHLPQYIILFTTGIIAYRKNWFIKISKRTGYLALILGIAMAFIIYLHSFIPESIVKVLFLNWAIYESFMSVFLCWGLIVLFREKINFDTPKFKFLAANSYAAYIFHFPIVLAIQYSLDKINVFGALGKFLLVSFLSIIATYFICSIIRKIPYVEKIL